MREPGGPRHLDAADKARIVQAFKDSFREVKQKQKTGLLSYQSFLIGVNAKNEEPTEG